MAAARPRSLPRELVDLPNVRELYREVLEYVFDYHSRVSETAPVAASASRRRVTVYQVLCEQLADAGIDSKLPLVTICAKIGKLGSPKAELATLVDTWKRYVSDMRLANLQHIMRYASYLGEDYFDRKMAECTLENCFDNYYWGLAHPRLASRDYLYLMPQKQSPQHEHQVEREQVANSRKRRAGGGGDVFAEVKANRVARDSESTRKKLTASQDSMLNWHTANYNHATCVFFSEFYTKAIHPETNKIHSTVKSEISEIKQRFSNKEKWTSDFCDVFMAAIGYSSSREAIVAMFRDKAGSLKRSIAAVVEKATGEAQKIATIRELGTKALAHVREKLATLEGKDSLIKQMETIENAFVSRMMTSSLEKLLAAAKTASQRVAVLNGACTPVCGYDIISPLLLECVSLCNGATAKIQTALAVASSGTEDKKAGEGKEEESKSEAVVGSHALMNAAIEAAKESWKQLAACDVYFELRRRYVALMEYLDNDPKPSILTALRVVDPSVDTESVGNPYVTNGREAMISCLWETTTTRASPIPERVVSMGEVVRKAIEMVDKQCNSEISRLSASADSIEAIRVNELHQMECADWVIPPAAYDRVFSVCTRLVTAVGKIEQTPGCEDSIATAETAKRSVTAWMESHRLASSESGGTERTEAFMRVAASISKLSAYCESACKAFDAVAKRPRLD